ncbi:MAG: hypothetical protein K2W95_17475 [Candidatus Obscuribacterales bacterium]|nr:hypothetical protein [Candidatus Obscuribacterales bacterium]
MSVPINISVAQGGIILENGDLELWLSKEDASSLLRWLEQTLDRSVSFLYRCDLCDGAIEGRNNVNRLDFLVFRESNEELRVWRFGLDKSAVPSVVRRLGQSVNRLA